MRLQSAIFDLDGTLLDSMGAWEGLMPDLVRELGLPESEELKRTIMALTAEESAAYCKKNFDVAWSESEILKWMDARMDLFYSTQVEAKPGVKEFLSILKMEGVWMYIATSTNRHQVELALNRTGLAPYFRGIITGQEVSAGKDVSAEIYEKAMTRLRGNKRDTVVFEDAIHAIRTASKAGFRVAAVYDPYAAYAEEEIRALSEIYIRSYTELFQSNTDF